MTIDVLLYNALCEKMLVKVATLSSDFIIPIVGSFPFSERDDDSLYPTTAIELFHITERNLFVIQIRSQPKEGVADRFAEELMDFVTSLRPQLFVVISSGDSTFFDLQSAQKLFVFYSTSPQAKQRIGEKAAEMDIVKEELNGSGLLSTVEKYCREKSFPFTAFGYFVTEGKNFQDAFAYFRKLNDVLQWLTCEEYKLPPVWSLMDPWMDEDIM